jgi:dCTP diphosphatase
MTAESFTSLTYKINAFVEARDWNQFHDPKSLSMALASEVGELCAILRWVSQAEADEFATVAANRNRLAEEIGDLGILLLRLCDRVGIGLGEAINMKLGINERKYPIEGAIGRPDPPKQQK